jgi:hypothetical protein
LIWAATTKQTASAPASSSAIIIGHQVGGCRKDRERKTSYLLVVTPNKKRGGHKNALCEDEKISREMQDGKPGREIPRGKL